MTQGDITFFRRKFFVSQFRKISLGTLHCFRKLLVAKIYFGCEVDITFLQQKLFCLTLPKNFIANFSLFQKNFLSSKTFHEKADEISFPSNIFCLTLSKKLKGNCSLFQRNSGGENFYGWENGTSRFFVDTFLSHFFETFIGKSSVFQKNSGSDKFVWMREWDITFFRRKLFVSFYRKILRGTLRRLGKILTVTMYYGWEGMSSFSVEFFVPHITKKFWENFVVSEMFWHWKPLWIGRGNHVFPSNFFCLALPKFCIGNSSCFQKKIV